MPNKSKPNQKPKAKHAKPAGMKTGAIRTERVPAAIGVKVTIGAPKITHHADGMITVSHREFVTDILTDTSNLFAYETFNMNPTDSITFPWLSALAIRYESFRFKKCLVLYEPMSGTSTDGKAIIAVDYDSKDDTTFTTKSQMMNWYRSKSSSFWQKFEHVSLVSDLQRVGPWRFVNESSTLDSVTDRLSSAGNIYVATTSTSAASVVTVGPPPVFTTVPVGELYVDYEIELKTPVLHNPLTIDAPTNSLENGVLTGTTVTGTIPAGAVTDVLQGLKTVLNGQGETSTIAYVDQAIGTGLPAGAKNVGTVWNFQTSGNVVPTNQTLIKFIKNFEGIVELCTNGNGTGALSVPTGPGAPAMALCQPAKNNPRNPNVSASPGVNPVLDYSSGISLGSSTNYTSTFVWNVAMAAGTALAITNASFQFLPTPVAGALYFALRSLRLIRSSVFNGLTRQIGYERKYILNKTSCSRTIYASPDGTLTLDEANALAMAP